MKLTTPQIVWHSKQPVLAADFHKNGPSWRLATGGADNDIKVELLVTLFIHSRGGVIPIDSVHSTDICDCSQNAIKLVKANFQLWQIG